MFGLLAFFLIEKDSCNTQVYLIFFNKKWIDLCGGRTYHYSDAHNENPAGSRNLV